MSKRKAPTPQSIHPLTTFPAPILRNIHEYISRPDAPSDALGYQQFLTESRRAPAIRRRLNTTPPRVERQGPLSMGVPRRQPQPPPPPLHLQPLTLPLQRTPSPLSSVTHSDSDVSSISSAEYDQFPPFDNYEYDEDAEMRLFHP